MTLALGTSLQHGTYVIDALSGDDSIGPLYLATHVPSGQWVLVRVLGSRHPELLPDTAQRTAFYQYLETLNQLGQVILPTHLHGFEEDRVCYQTFSQPQGSPLSQRVTPQNPMPFAASLAVVQRLAQDLERLRPLDWVGLSLAPDQVWQSNSGEMLTLTGLDFPEHADPNQPAPDLSRNEARLVRGLTELLYFLLTGQWASHTQATLAVDLRHHRPELPARLDAVLQTASLPLAEAPTLAQWLAQLPDGHSLAQSARPLHASGQRAAGPQQAPPPVHQPAATVLAVPTAPATPTTGAVMPAKVSQRGVGKRPWALMATGLIFGLGGVFFGLHARLQPNNSAIQSRFNPNQAFPPLPDWESPSPSFDNPTVESRRSRDRLLPTAEKTRPSLPSQTLDQPIPTSAPVLRDPVPAIAPRPTPSADSQIPSKVDGDFPRYDSTPDPLDSSPPALAPEPVNGASAPAPPTVLDAAPDVAPPAPVAPAPIAPVPVAPVPVAPESVIPAPVAPPPPTPLTSS
jgi:hypothetical protein